LETETRVPIEECPKVGHQSTADEAEMVSGGNTLDSRKIVIKVKARK
jgi:hypothetical protein